MNPVRLTVPLIFGCLIVLATFLLLYPFMPALLWALIASVMVWPIHRRCVSFLKGRSALVSAVLTIVLALIIAVPLLSILQILIRESQIMFNFFLRLDKGAIPPPSWLKHLPNGAYFDHLWAQQFSSPGGMAKWLGSFHYLILSFQRAHGCSVWALH